MDLRKNRLKKGYSQEEYARILGIAPRTLRYWESGDIAIPEMKLPEIKRRARNIKSKQ